MLKRLFAIMQKELIQTLRDRRTLSIQLLLPVFMLYLFGYAVEIEVDHQRTAVVDLSRDRLSNAYLTAMTNTGFFDIIGYFESEAEALRAIDDGRAQVAIIIPPGFSSRVERNTGAQVLVLIDGSDLLASQSALSAALATGQRFSTEVVLERVARTPLGSQTAQLVPLDVRFRVLYNPALSSIVFMIPGVVGLILQQQTLLLTAYAIVREREVGTIEQLLVTPIGALEVMLGKMLPSATITLVNVITILAIGLFWFKVPFAGNFGLFFILSLLFVFASLGLGLLVSTIATTQRQAQQLANVIILPAFMLSGYIFPREAMPPVVRALGGLIPLTYFLPISRGIMTKGVGFDSIRDDVLILLAFGLVVFGLSARAFRTRLD
jgi:ABC-2 type transport system permease protein